MTDSYTQVAARISDIVKTKPSFSREPSENESDAELEEIWHSTSMTMHKSQARFRLLFSFLNSDRNPQRTEEPQKSVQASKEREVDSIELLQLTSLYLDFARCQST